MSEQNGTNGAHPVFDFSNLSWKQSKQAEILQMRLRKALADNDIDFVERSYGEIESFLAQTVTYVPREWLVKDAPEITDWSDPSWFDYLRGDKMQELIRAMQESRAPESTTKN